MGFLTVLSQAQRFINERVRPGDIVVDATAGNGVDTLFLSRLVGDGGKVFAFDVQAAALEQTQQRLATAPDHTSLAPVKLVHAGHEQMAEHIPERYHEHIAGVMFNLGYLPGAQQTVITTPPTTLAALEAALRLLRSGGVLTAVVYPGHEGGQEEAEAVEAWASSLPSSLAQSSHLPISAKGVRPLPGGPQQTIGGYSMSVRKIEHVGIMVSSLDKSIPFYEKVAGMQHLETVTHTNGVIRLAFLSFPGSRDTEVELIEGFTGELANAGRVHHIAFTVDNIEEEYNRVRSLGVEGLDEEITALPNGSRYFFFAGPDGEAVEFFQSTRGGK